MKKLMRFSLRTFLLLIIGLAIGSAWVGNHRIAYQREQAALEQIQTSVKLNQGKVELVRAENFRPGGMVFR